MVRRIDMEELGKILSPQLIASDSARDVTFRTISRAIIDQSSLLQFQLTELIVLALNNDNKDERVSLYQKNIIGIWAELKTLSRKMKQINALTASKGETGDEL